MYKVLLSGTGKLAGPITVVRESTILKLAGLMDLYGFSYEGRRYTRLKYNWDLAYDEDGNITEFDVYSALEACRRDRGV